MSNREAAAASSPMTTDTPAAAPITAERTILAFGEGPWHVEHRTNAASDICDSRGRVVASCAWHEGAGPRAELLCDMLNSTLSAPVAAQPAEPVAYVNRDELDNMLADRTAIISGARDGWRKTALYLAPPAAVTDEQIRAGIAAANAMNATYEFADGSTAVDRDAARIRAFRKAAHVALPQPAASGETLEPQEVALLCAELCAQSLPTPEHDAPRHWDAYREAWGMRQRVTEEIIRRIAKRFHFDPAPYIGTSLDSAMRTQLPTAAKEETNG